MFFSEKENDSCSRVVGAIGGGVSFFVIFSHPFKKGNWNVEARFCVLMPSIKRVTANKETHRTISSARTFSVCKCLRLSLNEKKATYHSKLNVLEWSWIVECPKKNPFNPVCPFGELRYATSSAHKWHVNKRFRWNLLHYGGNALPPKGAAGKEYVFPSPYAYIQPKPQPKHTHMLRIHCSRLYSNPRRRRAVLGNLPGQRFREAFLITLQPQLEAGSIFCLLVFHPKRIYSSFL